MKGINNVCDSCSRALFNLDVLTRQLMPPENEKEYIINLSYSQIYDYCSQKEKIEKEIEKWINIAIENKCE